MTWKTKLPLSLISIAFILYSIVWFKVTSDMTNEINTRISGKIFNVMLSHRAQCQKATASGFPLVFGVKLHECKEDSSKAIIHHKNPIFVGYNIFTQELFLQYDGESVIETKPASDKITLISNGKFKYSATLPISLSTLGHPVITEDTPLEILSNMQNIKLDIKGANLLDVKDNIKIVDDANINIIFTVNHHRTYKNLEELTNDIPKDYDISVNIHSTNNSSNKPSTSTSLVYMAYIPFNIDYHLKTSFHTDATTFGIADIISNISLNNWESSMVNDFEDSSSKMNISAGISSDKIKCAFDTISQIKFKPAYAKSVDDAIKQLVSLLPPSMGGTAQSAIRQLDISSLNLDTKNDPVSVAFKGSINLTDKMDELSIDLPHLGVSFQDVSFDLKNSTQVNLKENGAWSSIGVVSTQEYETLTKYLIDSYFTMYHLPENVDFNNDFYLKMFMDFIRKIANNITHDNKTITIEYDLQPDVTKSMLGKFGWTETTLLYYSTLLKHISAVSKDSDAAMAKFKTMVPAYALEQEALDKIIIQSKE